jgi:hypothetical protein
MKDNRVRLPLIAAVVVLLVAVFAVSAFAQAPTRQGVPPTSCPMADDGGTCPMLGNGAAACPMARGAGVCPAAEGNGVCPVHAGKDGQGACPMAGGASGASTGMWGMMQGMMRGWTNAQGMMRGWTAPQGEQAPAWRMPQGCPMHGDRDAGRTL